MVLSMINHNLLRAAQSKAAIARYIGDGALWMSAYEGTRHNALSDAIHQAKYVSAIWQKLIK